jgi:hypothetical protein
MGTSLEDALDGKNTSEEIVETPVEAEPVAQAEPEAATEADTTPQGEPEPSDEEPKGWQYAAYKDEKTKRQELEKSNSDMQAQMAEIQRQNAEYQKMVDQQRALQQQRQDPQGHEVQRLVSQQVGQVEAQSRLRTSRMLASQVHGADKVQAAEQAFHGLRATNPVEYETLVARFGVHEDPIGQVMNWHKRHDMLTKMGDDPQAFIDAQVKAKLAELQNIPEPQSGAPQAAPVMPTDLSQTRNVGSRSGSNWSGPTSLEDIFKS